MPKSIYAQNSFISGVLEPRLLGRTDIQQYFQGSQQMDNVLLLPQGGFRVAPGYRFIDALPRIGATNQLTNTRMFEFSISSNFNYLLVFIDEAIRIYRNGIFIVELNNGNSLATHYASINVTTVNAAQIDNIIIFTHQVAGFRRIVAPVGVDDTNPLNWIYDVPDINAPVIDYNDAASPVPTDAIQDINYTDFNTGDTYKLILDGVATEDIAYSTNAQSHISSIETALANHPLTGSDGIQVTQNIAHPNTQMEIILFGSSADDYPLFTGYATRSKDPAAAISAVNIQTGSSRDEPAWSDTRLYPRCITFYNGRMYLANLPNRKSSVFGSTSFTYFDFDIGSGEDSDGIFATIATDKLNEVTNLISGRSLQIFTSGAEFYVPSSIPTPSDFEVRAQTNYGTSFTNPVQIDGATLFLEKKGKSLREFLFSFQEDSYLSNNISVLSQNLIIDPVAMTAQKGTASDDANYVIIVNSDGTVSVLNTLRSQGVSGYTRRITLNGKVKDVTVVDDVVYMAVEREINGVTVKYVEFWTFESFLDSSLKVDTLIPLTTVTGLDHLEGQTVQVIADGSNLQPKVVVGGEITLERPAVTYVEVGLWQPPIIKPMPLVGDGGTGNNSMRLKMVARASMRVYETKAIVFDGVVVPIRTFSWAHQTPVDSTLNKQPPLFTGVIGDLESNLGWNREQAPIITQIEPGPLTVLSIMYEMEAR